MMITIEYFPAPDVMERIDEIVDLLRFEHVNLENTYCVRREAGGHRPRGP
jgi:predicted metallopeptidase